MPLMKGKGILFLWAVLLTLSVISLAPPTFAKGQIPAELSGYYDILNFVVSYSTPGERKMIRRVTNEREFQTLPERLKKVGAMLHSLDRRVIGIDNTVNKNSRYSHLHQLPELIELTKIRDEDSGKIMIDVLVWRLSPLENALLISNYENSDNTFSYKDIKEEFNGIPRREIHTWINTGGAWMKRGVNIVLTDR